MDTAEIVKLIASGGLTVVLLYVAVTLWKAFMQQVSERIDFLEERLKVLEGARDDKTKGA